MPDGSTYQGGYTAGLRSGHGRFRWANGAVYEGQFLCNNTHDQGTYELAGQYSYTGRWTHNQADPVGPAAGAVLRGTAGGPAEYSSPAADSGTNLPTDPAAGPDTQQAACPNGPTDGTQTTSAWI